METNVQDLYGSPGGTPFNTRAGVHRNQPRASSYHAARRREEVYPDSVRQVVAGHETVIRDLVIRAFRTKV